MHRGLFWRVMRYPLAVRRSGRAFAAYCLARAAGISTPSFAGPSGVGPNLARQQARAAAMAERRAFAAPRPYVHHLELDVGRSENDDEQAWQEEQDHRHGQLRRQRGRLFLGLVHPHIAVFLRHHAQALAERGAVAFRLHQRETDRFHALEAGALGEVLIATLRSCR